MFSLHFWFNSRPGTFTPIFETIFIVFLVALLVAFVFFMMASKKKKALYSNVFNSLSNFSITNAIFGLFLLFFTYELIPWLSARFWFLIWGAVAIIWLYFILRKLKEIPERKEKIEAEKEFKKYIP